MTTSRSESTTALATAVLAVDGMTCGNCVRHVQQALAALAGVARAEVDLASGTARVTYRPELVRTEDLIAAVVEAGYEAAPRVR